MKNTDPLFNPTPWLRLKFKRSKRDTRYLLDKRMYKAMWHYWVKEGKALWHAQMNEFDNKALGN